MPRKGKRSQAQKLRWTKLDQDSPRACPPPADAPSRANYGTGVRLPVNPWPVSPFSGKQHKLVIPADAPDKKFVLVIGDSHLRGLVDGVHQMPPERFSFGFMSTPGACAAELRTEVRNAVLPRDPDLVCVLAPGNNLEASCTIEQSGRDFGLLLTSVRSRWPQLYVMDFVPRLTVEAGLQELLRQEFHRVAARMGVMYLSVAEHFPLRRRKLWCRDGVHLSDTDGMNILVQLLWGATYKQFLTPAPVQQLSPKSTSSPRRFSPILVVRGEANVAQPNNPFDWAVVGRGRKGQPAPAMAQAPPLPLNPVVFSPEVLDVMDQFVPSQLETPVSPASPKKTKPKRRLTKKDATPRAAVCLKTTTASAVSGPAPASPTQVTRVSAPTAELSAAEDAPSCSRAPVEQLPETPSPTKHTWTVTDTLSPFQSPVRKMMKTGPPPATSSIILDDAPSCSYDPVGKVTQAAAPTGGPSAVKDAASCSSSPVEPLPETPSPTTPTWTMRHGLSPLLSPARKMMKTGTPPGKSSILLDDEPSCSHDPIGIASARREEHSLRATHSQNDSRYTSFSRNHQCTCIALTFLAFQSEDVLFTTPHLDRVLEQGDSLYVAIKQQLLFEKRFHSNHLAVEELPRQVLTDENIYGVRLSDVRCGYLKAQVNSPGRKQWWLPLAKQLKCLSRDVSLALLLVSPECFAVFRTRSGEYGIFDSHSRSARGLPSPSGRAIMMTFTHLHGLVNHIHRLFRERSAYASYEFVPLSFEREVASPPRPPPQSNVTADVTESNVEDAPQPVAPKLCEEDQDHVSSVEDLPQPEAPEVCEEDQEQVSSVEDSPQSEAHNI
ncbi:ATP-dependent DNA helicase PIF2, partial [Solea senegalensis]